MIQPAKYAILISSRNRKDDLLLTLQKIHVLLQRSDTECVVFDDGSSDGTFEAINLKFPMVSLLRNETSKGYLYCRNKMLDDTQAEFAVSLDDDAHFLSEDPLTAIEKYFTSNSQCGLTAFRVFWGPTEPAIKNDDSGPQRVKGFVGCGHAWRMSAWNAIRKYPEWYRFYGEETFASLELLQNGWEVHYVPEILIHHRVDMTARSKASDFGKRYRNSLRADFFNYLIFYPARSIPKRISYVFWMQIKSKVLKGNFKVIIPILLACRDVIANMDNIIRNRRPLSRDKFDTWLGLKDTQVFWIPKDTSHDR